MANGEKTGVTMGIFSTEVDEVSEERKKQTQPAYRPSGRRSTSRRNLIERLATAGFSVGLSFGLFVGCGENKSMQDGGQIAVAPTSQPGAACGSGFSNGGPYADPYSQYGVQPYGANAYSQSGFCGCPAGYQTTCDLQYGLTCVPMQGFRNYEVAYWNRQPGGQPAGYGVGSGFSFSGYSPYAGYSAGYGSGAMYGSSACNQQIAQTCSVGTSQCGMGRCAPIAANSSIGICVR